jgi:shikimate dehydrogenase
VIRNGAPGTWRPGRARAGSADMAGAGPVPEESPDRAAGTMEFIGVSTSDSFIMRLFPLWAGELGLAGARLVGRDLPLHAEPGRYRETVERLRDHPLTAGALVTTHKVDLLAATRDLFDELDPWAELCNEVSCISKRDGRLRGHAKDPITAGRTLEALLGPGYFGRTGAEGLCFGAGGAGLAITVYLLSRPAQSDRPRRLIVTETRPERLTELRSVHDRLGGPPPGTTVEYLPVNGPGIGAELLAGLTDGSLVVNATGMGKDRPGSPIGEDARFPEGAVVWELNYRGPLDFLAQARRQAADRRLLVEDGWRYFLHGWSEHIAEVFRLDLTPERFARLRQVAETLGTPAGG